MDMFLSGRANADPDAAPSDSEDVQGLTQMYYLVEEEETAAAAVPSSSEGLAALPKRQPASAAFSWEEASMSAEPQGVTQVFYLDPEEEAEAAAALPLVTKRSFLRERLGVPGEVVQGLRQVRLEGGNVVAWSLSKICGVPPPQGAAAGVWFCDRVL